MDNIIEELKSKFKVANVAGLGKCIIIPMDKFQPEWDQQVLEAGCDAHGDGEAVYVSIDKYKPQETISTRKNSVLIQRWTDQEDQKLINLWTGQPKKTNEEIAKEFPNRSEHSVVCRLGRLKKQGIIEPRWHQKRKKDKRPPPEPARKREPEKPQLLGFNWTQLFEVLHTLSCRQLMQELQLRELKGDFVIPRKLWHLYWHAVDFRTDLTPPRESLLRFQKAATKFLAEYI